MLLYSVKQAEEHLAKLQHQSEYLKLQTELEARVQLEALQRDYEHFEAERKRRIAEAKDKAMLNLAREQALATHDVSLSLYSWCLNLCRKS